MKDAIERMEIYSAAFRSAVRVLKKLGAWRDWYALYPLERLQCVVTSAQEDADAKARA